MELWLEEMDTEIILYHLEKVTEYMHNPNFYKLDDESANYIGMTYVKLYNEYLKRTNTENKHIPK